MALIKQNPLIFLIYVTLFASGVQLKSIREMCGPYRPSEFVVFGTKEKVEFDAALTTKVKDYSFSFEKLKLDNPAVAQSFVKIDRSRTLETSEGPFKVIVSSSLKSPQLRLDIEVSQKLSGKPFVPRFFGCQIDNENHLVYHVSEDLDECVNLSVSENRKLFRELPKLTRLNFYLRLFEAIVGFGEAGFIHSHLDTYTVSQCTAKDGSIQPVINELGYAQRIKEDLDIRTTAKYWSPVVQEFERKATLKVDLFEAAVFVVDLEFDSKDDIFDSFKLSELDLFSYKFTKNQEGYLKLAASALEASEYGRADPSTISQYQLSNFSALVLALLNYDPRVADASKVLKLMSEIVQNEEKVESICSKAKIGVPEKQPPILNAKIVADYLHRKADQLNENDQNMII